MKLIGILLIMLGVGIVVLYCGYLAKKHAKQGSLNKAIFTLGEFMSFSPITIGVVILGIGLLMLLK